MSDELLTRKESQDYLKISLSTLERLIKSGTLPAVKIGRQVRIKRSDLERYATQTPIKPTSK